MGKQPPLGPLGYARRTAALLGSSPWWAPDITTATVGKARAPYGRGSGRSARVYHLPRYVVIGWAHGRPVRLEAVWACCAVSRNARLGRSTGGLRVDGRVLEPCLPCERARLAEMLADMLNERYGAP